MTTLLKTRRLRVVSLDLIKAEFGRFGLMFIGMMLGTMSYVLFQVPHGISWGGVGGLAIVLNRYTGMTHGMAFYLLGLPLLITGYFTLGGWKFVTKSIVVFLIYPLMTDMGLLVLPKLFAGAWPLTENVVMNAVFGGVLGGVSGGLIFKSGTTYPGTSVLSRTIQLKTGLPLSAIYMVVDGGVILLLGIMLGWEAALAGLLMLYIGGKVTDFVMEGPSTTMMVTVVTDRPNPVTNAMMATLGRSVSYWKVTGGYSGETRFMLMSTIKRTQLNDVKTAVSSADSNAFVTIGVGQKAMGAGFSPLR